MNIPKISALYESSLSSSLSAAGTSFSLVSANDRDGNALSGRYGFIIDEGSADEEFVIGTVSGTTVTIEYRGIDADAPNTEVSANKKAHRRGASVKITDYPLLGIIRNMINGDEGLPNPLKYASGVAPVTADDLVDKGYADALLGGGTLSYDRVVIAGSAGETIASGNLVYLKVSDGRWYLCDADTAATVDNVILGIAQGAGTAGNAVTNGVLIKGLATNLSGLSANTKYYASNTAGALSTSAGTVEVSIGFALSTTSLLLDSRYDQQITEDQQDALTGTSGTPSNSNKFVTNNDTTGTGAILRRSAVTTHFLSNTVTTVAGDAAETAIYSRTIPGGTLGTTGMVRVVAYVSDFDLDFSGSADAVSFRLKYGSTTLATATVDADAAYSNGAGKIEFYIIGAGTTSSQRGWISTQFANATSVAATALTAYNRGTATEVSTGDLTLQVTADFEGSNASNSITVDSSLTEYIT